MQSARVIANCRVLANVAPERRAELAEHSRSLRFEKGAVIFRQGDPVPGMYIVATGMVRIYKIAPTGKEHTLHFASPTQTFAEVAAIAGFPCPAWAEAVEATEAVLLPTRMLHDMLERDHRLCLELLAGMGHWVRHLTSLLEDIVLRDAAARVARLLIGSKREADGTVTLVGLRKHIASQLNLTPETLSRTLHRFLEHGLVEVLDDQRLRILDAASLEALSGTEGLA